MITKNRHILMAGGGIIFGAILILILFFIIGKNNPYAVTAFIGIAIIIVAILFCIWVIFSFIKWIIKNIKK